MADVKATVLLDLYRWKDDPTDERGVVNEATRGETVTVSQAELERGEAMHPPGLAKGENPDGDAFADTPVEIPADVASLSKGELRALATKLRLDVSGLKTSDELVGAITAAPGYERPTV